jgi:hypothetical protein
MIEAEAFGTFIRVYSLFKSERLRIFAILDKAKPDIENIRDLNLAAVKHTTVEVTRPPL